jgi:hypothetical protein
MASALLVKQAPVLTVCLVAYHHLNARPGLFFGQPCR